MIVTYRDDILSIYYYDEEMRLNVDYVYSDGYSWGCISAFTSLKEIRRTYRDEIIHDDNIN